MAWTEVFNRDGNKSSGDSGIQGWHTPGQNVEGIFRGLVGGKPGYKPLVKIEVEGNVLTFKGATVLEKKMAAVKPGDRIKIVYQGKKNGANGQYYDFQVFVDAAPEALPFPKPPTIQEIVKKYDEAEFNRLIGDIRAARNATLADAIAAIAKESGDPVKSVLEAMAKIGVAEVPF
jgi:hypothetical protein